MEEVSAAVASVHDRSYHIQSKGEAGPLTEADLLADSMLRERLTELCPECGWISEESPEDTNRLGFRKVWITDPIDGTKEFIEKNGQYSVSVGLAEDGVPVFGAVALPSENRLIIGGMIPGGISDIRSGKPSVPEASLRRNLFGSRVMVSRSEWKKGVYEAYRNDFDFDVQGSIARKLALLAAGECDLVVSLYPKNEWDICGGTALVRAVKGYSVYKLSDGKPHTFNSPDLVSYGLVAGPDALCLEFAEYSRAKKMPIFTTYA